MNKKSPVSFKSFFCQGLLLSLLVFSQPSFSNPQGAEVAAGGATISSPTPNTMQINQTTHKAIINWQSFNIGAQEKVQFQQPSASSIALNRVNPNQGPSQINGVLTANGHVWLVNPAGVWIGSSAYINVGGLIATTLNITDQNFLSGNYKFEQSPNWNGLIINEGTIKIAEAGLLALVGLGVVNNGLIEANLGTVVLASGNVSIGFSGNENIQFSVDPNFFRVAKDKNSNPLPETVSNSGKIIANGGKVLMSSNDASRILDRAINMKGIVEANSVATKNGEIILMAGSGKVTVSGKLLASGKKSGESGGKVRVLGNQVALIDGAVVNASGDVKGGEILIGGDYQGKNSSIANAKNTFVGAGVSMFADALSSGNGGKVIVWADHATDFYGSIYARGGAEKGNGGLVEVSGKEALDFDGYVNTLAPHGETGMLLLDPRNINVTANGQATLAQVSSFSTNPNANRNISSATINAAASNVTLQANTDITFANAVAMTNAGVSLTAQAGRSILVNANVSTNNGAINLIANDPGAIPARRSAGAGNLMMAAGTSINSGTAALSLTVDSTSFTPGSITAVGLTGGAISLTSPNALTGTGAIAQSSSLSINIGSASSISGVISGAGNITKLGAGTLTLSGANSYTGSTTINAGILSLTNASGLGNTSSTTITSGAPSATLDLNFNSATLGNTNTMTLAGTGTSSITFSGSDITLNNPISLTNDGVISGSGVGTITLGGAISGTKNLTITLLNAALSLPDITLTGKNLSVRAGGELMLNGSITATGTGDSIVLSSTRFNNSGNYSFVVGGRYLVWSSNSNPFGGATPDNRGGLSYDFKQYNATYGVTPISGSGNGFLYTLTPSVTPLLTGIISKIYNGNTIADLTGHYTSTGSVDGDTVTFNPTTGNYDNKNVGSGKTVSVSGVTIASASNGAAIVYGYELSTTSASSNTGEITPASLTVSSNTSQSKIYGDDDPLSAKTAYSITSGTLYGSDSLTGDMGRVAGELVGNYNFTQNTVAVSDGNNGANYNLIFNGSTNKFQITTRTLTATIANQTKTYGTNDPSLSGILVTLGNVVDGSVTDINGNVTAINDTGNVATSLASLTRMVGENIGNYNITAGALNALTGSAASNYNAATDTGSSLLTINQANLTVTANPATKIYGTSDPVFTY
ncbi:MAG: hypothetical protein ACD_46C00549G0006, partial [uncultured bacterium]